MKNRLFLLLAVVAVALPGLAQDPKSAAPAGAAASKASLVKNVNVETFEILQKGTNVVILDVRTPAEFAEGHLKEAILIDFRAPDFTNQVAKLDKSKVYLVHCAAGGRSARACTKLEAMGFTNLVNLEGGLGAWKDAGKPVVK